MEYSRLSEEVDLKQKEKTLQEKASLLSKLTFTWVQPLLRIGYKRPLEFSDVPPLPREYSLPVLGPSLQARISEHPPPLDWWSLTKIIWSLWGTEYMWLAVPNMIYLGLSLASPVFISYLIEYAGDKESPPSEGVKWLALLVLSMFAKSFCEQQAYNGNNCIMGKIQTSLRVCVYAKSLKVSTIPRGNATNLLNIDPEKVGWMSWNIHQSWRVLLQIIFTIVLLYQWLSWTAFVPLAITILLAPLNWWMLSSFHKIEDVLTQLMDKRIKILTEILHGIGIIKLFSWEDSIAERVYVVRNQEVRSIKKYAYFMALLMCLLMCLSTVIGVVTFSSYSALGHQLKASIIFPALVLFSNLTWPIIALPGIVSSSAEALVALKRLAVFFAREELPAQERQSTSRSFVSIRDGDFSWQIAPKLPGDEEEEEGTKEKAKDNTQEESGQVSIALEEIEKKDEQETEKEAFQLKNINFEVQSGQIVAIIGRVGSGKTALLRAILGEMKVEKGTTKSQGTVAYIPQQAWIRNEKVRDNILFGQPHDESRYRAVTRHCALEEDFRALPAGDLTEIGEKGVNISGGQKQRVSLARAEYSDRDIYLFDDPLSAVDAHVGRHLFNHCINGALKEKTRILVTHQLQYLPQVDYIYILDKGQIQQHGTYQQLVDQGYDFATLLKQNSEHKGKGEGKEGKEEEKEEEKDEKDEEGKGKTVSDEERVTGAVKAKVYLDYLKTVGPVAFLVLLFFIAVSLEVTYNLSSWWLALWSDEADSSHHSTWYYMSVYIYISLASTAMAFLRQFLWARGTTEGAQKLHNRLLNSILRAPMSFFYATPSGRILNRFSKDQDSIDKSIPEQMSDWLLSMFACVGALLFIAVLSPYFTIFLVPLAALYYYIQQYFRKAVRELGRLYSLSSSPIYAQYSETLDGLESIRAFNIQPKLRGENETLVDGNFRVRFLTIHTQRWLAFRLDLIAESIILSIGILILWLHGSMSDGFAGLFLSLAATITVDLSWWVRQATNLESQMNNVERVLHYIDTPSEAALVISSHRPPPNWPQHGEIEFRSVSMRYREDLDLVLKDMNFVIRPREKIGIVGRTGAGKSSLTNALFRLVEPLGSIFIDKVDIRELGLRDLRTAIAIIPQDPFLFSGTIRSNLDPFSTYTDAAVWVALTRVHLEEFVKSLPKQLSAEVQERGSNLSVGQRQLLCMGRALLRDTKILVVDEATASVDHQTDELIQKTIRTEFAARTVITIAHRLHTIMDSDRIFVLDKGKMVESGAPSELLAIEKGYFRHLVNQTEGRGVGAAAAADEIVL